MDIELYRWLIIPAVLVFLLWLKNREDKDLLARKKSEEWVLQINTGFNEWFEELKSKRK